MVVERSVIEVILNLPELGNAGALLQEYHLVCILSGTHIEMPIE
jgi:hypothetical protein